MPLNGELILTCKLVLSLHLLPSGCLGSSSFIKPKCSTRPTANKFLHGNIFPAIDMTFRSDFGISSTKLDR